MKVLELKDQKDGSAIMTYELSEHDLEVFKQVSKKHTLTNDDINKIVLDAIKASIKSEKRKEDKKTKSNQK